MSWARGMLGIAILALACGGCCTASCPKKSLERCPNPAAAEAEPEPEPESEPEPEVEEPDEADTDEDGPPPPPPVASPARPKEEAGRPANKKVQPPGSGWYCHEARDRGTGTFLGARCNRNQAECETAKAKLLDHYKAKGLGGRIEMGPCESRVRADCFTAFDIGYDQYAYFCFDSTKDCNAARKSMERSESESYRELSRCEAWY